MGGTESSGGLQLDIAERNIEPGQSVTGHIHLFLTSDIQAETLTLKFKGKEYVQWKEVKGGNKSVRVEKHTGTHLVCVRRFPVFLFEGGQVRAGSYTFPFAMQVPDHLPGTFAKKGKMMKAFITYRLTALIEKQQAVKRSKTELILTRPYAQSIVPMRDEVTASVRSCCCFSMGEVSLKAYFDKNAYRPREEAEVIVEVDNAHCRASVVRVTAELHRKLRLQDNTGREHEACATLSTASIDTVLAAGRSTTSANPVRLTLPIDGNSDELNAAATVIGTRMECTHFIRVRAFMSGWFKCCGQKPKVDRPVTIFPSPVARMEVAAAPPGWNPTVMRRATFAQSQERQEGDDRGIYAPLSPGITPVDLPG